MGFKIGRSTDAPVLQTKKTARYGEQKVVATETPVATEQEEVVDITPENIENDIKAPEVPVSVVVEEEKPAKVKRGRKPKKA